MYTRFGEVKFEFPALAALKSEHQGHHFLVPIISRDWPPLELPHILGLIKSVGTDVLFAIKKWLNEAPLI